ncbi:unnamed protein product [Chironomus riparius]|uniref:Cytochrome P450 n=1 Tax=Chironomus riparius TaxID=315576 RepID=A0A9N9S4M4_9DIPT|nr:unnamed protein product [Chironomus riparius]
MLVALFLLNLFIIYITITSFKYFWNRRRLYKLASQIPGHNGLPIVGILPKYLKIDKKEFFSSTFDMMDPNATLTKIWVGPKLMLLTEDPDVIHTVFNSTNCINKPDIFYHALTVINGLLPLSGPRYLEHRRILNKSFMLTTLQKIQPIIEAKCNRMIKKLEGNVNKELDIMDFVGACALESFGEAQFGYSSDLYGFEGHKIIKESLEFGLDRVTQPWLHYLPEFIFKMTEINKKIDKVISFCIKYKAKVTETYNQKKVEDYDSVKHRVIDVLLNSENNLSDIEIRDELIMFTIGSYDTTAKTVSFLIFLTAMHPDVQSKLIDEIDSICGTEDNLALTIEFFKKFEYMEMVIKETMRLFPVGPSVARTNDAEIEIGGFLIPKDSIFLMSLMRMHRNPKYWGHDAHLFKPERFAGELRNSRSFAPFTGGKRLCIGTDHVL